MESEIKLPRDIRYQCLVTVQAILLFLPILLLSGMMSRIVLMASELDMELPVISGFFMSYPYVTLALFLGLMISTIIFAWCNRKGAILTSFSLLMQGIALGLYLIAILLPWMKMWEALRI